MFYFEPWIDRGKCQFTAYWRQSCSNLKRGCYVLSASMILYYNYWFPASEHYEHCSHIQSLHVKMFPWTQQPRAGLYNSNLKLDIVDDGLDSWQLSSIQLLMQNIIYILCLCASATWHPEIRVDPAFPLILVVVSTCCPANGQHRTGATHEMVKALGYSQLVHPLFGFCMWQPVCCYVCSGWCWGCFVILQVHSLFDIGGPLCVPRAPCRVKEQ